MRIDTNHIDLGSVRRMSLCLWKDKATTRLPLAETTMFFCVGSNSESASAMACTYLVKGLGSVPSVTSVRASGTADCIQQRI